MGKSIKIQGKTYPLKFGYGAFRILGDYWEAKSIQKVAAKFQELFQGGTEDVSFEQADALGKLALAGIESGGCAYGDLPEADDVVGELLFDPEKIETVMTAFTESFPQQGNAEPRSKARKKATAKK